MSLSLNLTVNTTALDLKDVRINGERERERVCDEKYETKGEFGKKRSPDLRFNFQILAERELPNF